MISIHLKVFEIFSIGMRWSLITWHSSALLAPASLWKEVAGVVRAVIYRDVLFATQLQIKFRNLPATMNIASLLIFSFVSSLHGKKNLRQLKISKIEICPAIKCVDPCMEYSPSMSQAKPKCSDNEVCICVTKPWFFRKGKLTCSACDSFVQCEPKPDIRVDPMPCPKPACLEPCFHRDFMTGLSSPKCPEPQKCITNTQYHDPDSSNCPMCAVFDHCQWELRE